MLNTQHFAFALGHTQVALGRRGCRVLLEAGAQSQAVQLLLGFSAYNLFLRFQTIH